MPQDAHEERKLAGFDGTTASSWARRAGVLVLSGAAGWLILGPSQEVLIKIIGAAFALMVGRAGQRLLTHRQIPGHVETPMSRRGYAMLATSAAGLGWAIWALHHKAWISVELVPALVCVWLAVYLFRGT